MKMGMEQTRMKKISKRKKIKNFSFSQLINQIKKNQIEIKIKTKIKTKKKIILKVIIYIIMLKIKMK